MDLNGRLIQGNVFQIGASVGVILEITCPNRKEATKVRDMLEIIVTSTLEAELALMDKATHFTTIEGETYEETIRKIAQAILRSE